LILFSSALELIINKIKIMNDLIIDATTNKIFLTLIKDTKNIYTSKHENSKNNFDKLVILIDDLLDKNKLLTKNLNRVYVNRGPGSFSGIRSSISIAKGYHVSENIDYYCFSFLDFINIKNSIKDQIIKNSSLLSQYHNIKYEKIPELCSKYKIKKNLIKPLYLS
jgi:tRNA A37 threonylcarbamoyladenosine modification protein TsaB